MNWATFKVAKCLVIIDISCSMVGKRYSLAMIYHPRILISDMCGTVDISFNLPLGIIKKFLCNWLWNTWHIICPWPPLSHDPAPEGIILPPRPQHLKNLMCDIKWCLSPFFLRFFLGFKCFTCIFPISWFPLGWNPWESCVAAVPGGLSWYGIATRGDQTRRGDLEKNDPWVQALKTNMSNLTLKIHWKNGKKEKHRQYSPIFGFKLLVYGGVRLRFLFIFLKS